MHSLANFRTASNSPEEVRFGQVKAVYQGLRVVLDGADQDGGYSVLCDFAKKVDPLIKKSEPTVVPSPEAPPEKKPYLFGSALDYISHRRGSHEDVLRRVGLELVDTVAKDGSVSGNSKRVLTTDFVRLARLFGHDAGRITDVGDDK
jgi:hypothetical protein